MNTTKVYLVIVTYNAMKWVDKCFSSLRKSEIKCYPVVVDNCSKDETVAYIREHYPEVHLIVNEKNLGFGHANNQGIEYAYKEGCTHFFLLNQDAWIHQDTISKIVEIQNKYDFAIVSPIHLNGTGNKMDFGFFTSAIERNIDIVSDIVIGNMKSYYEVPFINAAAWSLSRRCIETIGGFDPIFFHYGEDNNYIQRLKYNNEKIVFVPNSYIHHDRGQNGGSNTYNKYEVLSLLLMTYSNINVPLISLSLNRIKFIVWLLKRFFEEMLKFHFSNCFYILRGYISFLGRLSYLRYSREQNRKIGANWLNLETR